jgi:spermidine synthase
VTAKNKGTLPIALILLLFFVSGALALVYQVVWSRMMIHIFGSTAIAVGTVLAAFMSGMAGGSWLVGRLADRSANCLRLYAWLELGIAVAALLSHALLDAMITAYPALHAALGVPAGLFSPLRFAMAFALVALPTFLMGATLPVLTRYLLPRGELIGVNLSTLYAVNTLGAVAGVLLTGFVLIGLFGLHPPVLMAAAGNGLIGVIAWLASRRADVAAAPEASAPAKTSAIESVSPAMYRLVLFGLGLSGLTSFAYEIYWTRSLVFILGNSTYALTTMLSAFLTGIALGGYGVRFLIRTSRDRVALFGWIQVALGLFSALALPLLFFLADPQALNRHLLINAGQAMLLVFSGFGIAFLVMLVPAALIGCTFPLAGQIGVRDPEKTGASVGRVYAINTLGNVLGALLPGFVLLNWLGIQRGIVAMAALNLALGFTILFARLAPRGPAWKVALPLLLLTAAGVMSRAPLDFRFPSDGERPDFETLYYREGPLATTKVTRDPRSGEKHMSVDGIVIGGTGQSEFKQLLLAHLPKLLLDDFSDELSVGLGSGILAGESLRHERVAAITGVEIEPSVVEGAGWFAQENDEALANPRLEVVVDDVGNFLRTTDGVYDVISADEKTADEYASNGFSYSLDYYLLLDRHLADRGLVAQWVPTTLPPSQYRMVLKTFSEAFPHVQLWYFLPAQKRGPFNTLLVGSRRPIPLDYARIQRRFDDHTEALSSLEPYGITSALALLPHFVAADEVIRDAVRESSLNTLDHPRYEFFYPWDYAIGRQEQVISNHRMLSAMRREAFPVFLAEVKPTAPDPLRLRQALAAEVRYLDGFERFLGGLPVDEQYRVFDDALSVAPWNDSLRARIYAQYAYIAASRSRPAERERAWRKARSLYESE